MEFTDGPLKIVVGGTNRIVDSLYRAGDRYFFLDTDWVFSPTHPYHEIGRLVDEGRWEWVFEDAAGNLAAISLIDTKEDLDFYNGWKEHLQKEHPGLRGIDVIEKRRGHFRIPQNVRIEQISI